MTGSHPDPIQRWHRQRRSQKQGPKPRRCTNPRCPTGWAAMDGRPYCLHCHQLTEDRGDEHRVKVVA